MKSTITFKPRLGKDLFTYLSMSEISEQSAKNWAIESFVLIDDKEVTLEQIARMSDRGYLMISEKIFSMNTQIEENNLGVIYDDGILIKRKKVHRDFITSVQANAKGKTSGIKMIKAFITEAFEVTNEQLETLPYQVVAYLFKEVKSFLDELTASKDQFAIDDLFESDSSAVVSE